MEEEKLLNIIGQQVTTKSCPNGNLFDNLKTPIKIADYCEILIQENSSKVDPSTFYRDQEYQSEPTIVKKSLTKEELYQQLREETFYLRSEDDSQYEPLIKPVKITSPLAQYNLNEEDLRKPQREFAKVTPRIDMVQNFKTESTITPQRTFDNTITKEESKQSFKVKHEPISYPVETPTK